MRVLNPPGKEEANSYSDFCMASYSYNIYYNYKYILWTFSYGSARNKKTTASAVSFSAILSDFKFRTACEILDLDSSYQFNLCRQCYWGQGNWIAS